MSPTAKTSGWPGSERSGSTIEPPAPADGRPGRARRAPRRSRRSPTRRCGRRSRCRPSRCTLVSSMRSTPTPRRTSAPRRSSVRRARRDDCSENGVSRRSAISTSTMRASATGSCGKSLASTLWYSSSSPPAISTPVAPPPQTTTSSAAGGDEAGVGAGPLEPVEEVRAQGQGVVEVLEREGVLGDAGDPEVGGHRAGGEHQRVVREPHRRPRSSPPARRDPPTSPAP